MPKPPASRRTSQRVPRCSFTENGRRCTFGGYGEPPFCRAHKLVIQETAVGPGTDAARRRPGAAVADLLHRFVNGYGPTREDFTRTIEAEAWAFGGHIAEQYYPHVDDPTREQDGVAWDPGSPPPGPDRGPQPGGSARPGWRPSWGRSSGSSPPPMDEVEIQRQRARKTLGFSPTEPLTTEQIRDRVRELAKRYHPDRAGRDEVKRATLTKAMQSITEAANILMT